MTLTSVRHRAEYALVLAVRWTVGLLPDRFGRALGTLVGSFFYVVDGSHRRLAVRQLRAAFPLRTTRECRAIARAMFGHFGRALVALLKFSALSADGIRRRVEYEGDDRMQAALARGRGVLIFSGHFGFWELQGLAHPLRFPPMHVVVRPLDNPWLDGFLDRVRRATGNKVIARQGAVRRAMRALAANECVAIMIDQHIQPKDAVAVEFFNRPAATTAALASLALRTGAPIVPVFCLPLDHGRYRMIYEHPVECPAADAADPVRELTQRCTDVLEMYVRRRPDLWLWMHRRWRDGEPPEPAERGMFPAAASDIEEPRP
jgi:Kdo2-lipid IVA lauroyltransferase/acyltransferase